MKWFHHECSAKHDPKLQALGEEVGAEGIGVYWMLLEEIGHHSDTFHIKINGVSAESDRAYADALLHGEGPNVSIRDLAGPNVPRIPLKILALLLFTTEKKLQKVIEKSVEVGLFDDTRWRTYALLYSPAFEHRADVYTRRRRQSTDHVRTHAEHSPDNARTHPEHSPARVRQEPASVQQRDSTSPNNVRPEQTTEQKEIQKEREKQKEKEIEEEKKLCSVPSELELSTACAQPAMHASDDEAVVVPSVEYFTQVCKEFREIIREWNEHERSTVDWLPMNEELKKLFYGGDSAHKLWLCRQAMNLMGGKLDFPGLVIRSLNLMLEASTKQRVQNPFGWTWSCLHGTPEGMPPWVHLPTPGEETRRIGSPRSPP